MEICCYYQNSELHGQNDETNNPHNLCEPIFKECGNCYFSINTGLLTKEKQALEVTLTTKSHQATLTMRS